MQILIENKGFTSLFDKISKSTMESPLKKSSNILKSPKFIPYRLEGENLFLEKPFTLNGKKINNSIFKMKNHGTTMFSESFSSDSKNLFCRGTVKKGSKNFFLYYCDEK